VKCGFTTITNVLTKEYQDHMESFFLAETLKYLYLSFDPLNSIHNETVVFTTEAHPLKVLVHENEQLLGFKKGVGGKFELKNLNIRDSKYFENIKKTKGLKKCLVSDWRDVKLLTSFTKVRKGFDFMQ
jgi:Glycosyl hydrolase family 47